MVTVCKNMQKVFFFKLIHLSYILFFSVIGIFIMLASNFLLTSEGYILFISIIGILITSFISIMTFHKQTDVDSARFCVELCRRVNKMYTDEVKQRLEEGSRKNVSMKKEDKIKYNKDLEMRKMNFVNEMEQVAVLTKEKVIKEFFTMEFFDHVLKMLSDENNDFRKYIDDVNKKNPKVYDKLLWLLHKYKSNKKGFCVIFGC